MGHSLILVALFLWLFKENMGYHTDDHISDLFEYVLLNSEHHPCTRKCVKDAAPMMCRYNFTLESYHSLSKACFKCPYNEKDCFRKDCMPADGNGRPVMVVNRQMPGPSIEVCLGDEVIIDVKNDLPSDSTTIHWHGHHQRNSPYMDGVPFVTQCPINPGSIFRYQFHVHNAGTHFWHSHSGFQRSAAFGPFIVRTPKEDDLHNKLYDYDLPSHVITLMDWTTKSLHEKFLGFVYQIGSNKGETILVNGLGRTRHTSPSGQTAYSPTAKFTVKQGYKYRFRLVNAGFLNCPVELTVDNHTLTVISSDGNDFNASEVDSLVSYAGERFDFIINANQKRDVYWMHFKGLMDCDARYQGVYQVAVLKYENANADFPTIEPSYNSSFKPGKQMNPLNKGIEADSSKYVTFPKLGSLEKWDDTLKETPDFQYYVSYDFYKKDHPLYHKTNLYGFYDVNEPQRTNIPQINYITMQLQSFPLLSQRHQITEDMFCNETTVHNCAEGFCGCTHVVHIPLNSVVEMVMIDKGYSYDYNHPFHLHGHSFRVVAMEQIGESVSLAEVKELDRKGLIKRNLQNAPIKDTVTIPDGGYTIVRFKATNPGYWLFHCHIEFHVEVGMSLVFKVGNDEDMLPVPDHFPTCGNYLPTYNKCDTLSSMATVVTFMVGLLLLL